MIKAGDLVMSKTGWFGNPVLFLILGFGHHNVRMKDIRNDFFKSIMFLDDKIFIFSAPLNQLQWGDHMIQEVKE